MERVITERHLIRAASRTYGYDQVIWNRRIGPDGELLWPILPDCSAHPSD